MPSNAPLLSDRTFLLGVGAHKSGTSWLYYYLEKHPDIFMSPVKEMHFFGNRGKHTGWAINNLRKKMRQRKKEFVLQGAGNQNMFNALRERIQMKGDIEAYQQFFQTRIRYHPIFGEITPAYCRLDIEELTFINTHMPNTKIIFLMRNPVDRLWSHMRFAEKFDTVTQLEALLDEILNQNVYILRSNYAKIIQNLQSVFRPDQIHFEFYENLFTDAAVNRLCAFLQITPMDANFVRKRNMSPDLPLNPMLRPKMAAKLRPQYEYVMAKFGDQVPQKWLDDLD